MQKLNKLHKTIGAIVLFMVSGMLQLRSCSNTDKPKLPLQIEAEANSVSLPPDAELRCPYCKKTNPFSTFHPNANVFIKCPECGKKMQKMHALKYLFQKERAAKEAAK